MNVCYNIYFFLKIVYTPPTFKKEGKRVDNKIYIRKNKKLLPRTKWENKYT